MARHGFFKQMNSQEQVFNHFICRAAGLSNLATTRLRAARTVSFLDRAAETGHERHEVATRLEHELFQRVDGEEDRDLRRLLLRLKRNVHNGRPLRPADLDRLAPEPHLRAGMAEYGRLLELETRLLQDARQALGEEVPEIRRRFQDAVGDEDFENGLLLSSRSLSDQLQRYRRASPRSAGAKARQIERSLMRYFSRMALKATPFATFCSLLPGRISDVEAPTFVGDPSLKRSAVRLNKTLYVHILRALYSRAETRHRLPLELNPTLDTEAVETQGGPESTRWVFLTARGQQEIFQRLPENPVVRLLIERLQEDGATPWQHLSDLLQNHPDIQADADQAGAYVDRLVEIGLFRFRLGIPEQEANWDRPLIALLNDLQDPLANRIVRSLEELRAAADTYPASSTAARRRLLDDAQSQVDDLLRHLAGDKAPPELVPFYEDAGSEARLELSLGSLEPLLLEYVELTSRLAWPRAEQANMAHFFRSHYGSPCGSRSGFEGDPNADPGDGVVEAVPTSVPLLRFYEDYFRLHFKAHLQAQRRRQVPKGVAPPSFPPSTEDAPQDTRDDGRAEPTYNLQNPFDLPLVSDLDHGHRRLTARVQELWQASPEAEEIVLRRADLEAAVGDLPPLECRSGRRSAPLSVSLFAQYLHRFRADGSPALVARTYLTGFGKYFSRFLYLLPSEIEDAVRSNNAALTDHETAEICGDANFNANLHPPLLPKELSYPTGQGGEREHQIPAADVAVRLDPDDESRLQLVRRSTGERLLPVDLGFLNPRMRPYLFQLLSRFTPVMSFNWPIPDSPDAAVAPKFDGLRYRPRVSYEGGLILARRQWQVTDELFPRPTRQERPEDYFFRLQAWRRELGLPDEVFVRATLLPARPSSDRTAEVKASEKGRDKKKEKTREHLYKPQYVDFSNPILVDLLGRYGETLDRFTLTFEERLPAAEHLPRHGDDAYACEMIFQADFPGGFRD